MISRLLFVFALTAAAVGALAADKEVEELLTKMRKVYMAARSAKIVTESAMPTDIGEVELTIETTYVRPDKIYAKITGIPEAPNGITLKTDGKTVLYTGPGGPKRSKYDPEGIVRSVPVNLETINFWDWKRQLSTKDGGNMKTSKFKIIKKETWKNKDWLVLEETATGQNVFVRYFIDPKTYFIHRTRVETLKEHELLMDVKVTKMEINPSIDVSIFKVEEKKDKKEIEQEAAGRAKGNAVGGGSGPPQGKGGGTAN